ncbi:MAG: alpha-2-macroglobulin family protein [Alphaproteobacteria bacterium]|nr:alpha-2-macroglobulin family protein [Alphaproteobacteria bacterium]
MSRVVITAVVYFLFFGLITAPQALAEAPINGQIDDPVFIGSIKYYDKAENKKRINFYLETDRARCRSVYGENYYSACAPRLGLSGKRADAGISISPPIKGEWRWSYDYQLSFTPSEHWQADQSYVIDFDLDQMQVPPRVVFAKNARKTTFTLKAKALNVEIKDMRYMQDPDDPQRKIVTAHLEANYPVVTETLEKQIGLTLETEDGGKLSVLQKALPYDLKFAADGMNANISVPIQKLPDQDHYLKLEMASGIEPEFGGKASAQTFKERARVPSLGTYLTISEAGAVIARAESGAPRQLLSFESNVKAKPEDVLGKTKAYLLPFDHPVTARAKDAQSDTPYRWQAANEVTSAILDKSEVLTLEPMPAGQDYATQFGFGFQAPAGRYVYMSVDSGLSAFGGYTLENPYEAIIKVPDTPHDIEIMQEGAILSLSGAQKLSLHARGTDQLNVEVAQILPEALSHFIAQTEGDIRTPSFKNWRFDKEDIARIDEKDIKMAYADPYASQYAAFDFAPYLKDDRKGIFLLNIQGFKDNEAIGSAEQRFVLVTDMGLLVKQNADKSRDVFLTSFRSGTPVKGADILVLGRNGLPVFTGKTDHDGHIALPDFGAYTKDRAPVAITAQKGGDYSFIPYDRRDRVLNVSRFDVGGTRIAADGLNAFMFSDRGIYRPGETAHIGMIVQNADWQALPPSLPLKIEITDPRGRVVKDELLNLSATGLEEISLETEETGATGIYSANLYIAGDGKKGSILGSTTIRVEEFMPDRLKISTAFLQGGKDVGEGIGWVKPDDLKASIDLRNLYGTPASERKVTGAVTLNPARLSFKEYKDYHFYDPYAAKPRSIQYDLPSVKTDQDGHAQLDLKLGRQERATYSLNLEATGYEAGSGKGVTAYSTALVSPMDYALGYHSDTNLGYLRKGKDYAVQLLALSPSLTPMGVDGLSLELVKRSYVSTLIKRDDGSFIYESVPKEEGLKTEEFKIADGGTSLSLPTDDLGEYIYRLKTKDGLIVLDVPFSIAGEGQRKNGIDREAALKLKTNKSDYAAGETIELNITAPYIGAGLITLESDHIVAHKWFSTDKTETLQTIDIPKDFSGKGYVNVAFVRDINAREIYMNPLSNAIVPFTAGTENRTVAIDLGVPETAKPGEAFEIKYKGNQKGKAIIFAVDEGILQVAKYKTPDPVDYFLLSRALQVQTSQMLDLLMPDYELIKALSANGGGAAKEQAVLGKHLNPFQRKTLAPAVYWSGIVDLDTEVKTLSFTPPGHFNGQLRVMAVAVSAGRVGAMEKDMTVRSDIVMTPNVPLFLAPGDTAEASVTIANGAKGSGADATISVRLEPSAGLSLIIPPAESVKIAEGSETSLAFTIKATEALGPASLILHAELGEAQQSAEATLSIRPPTANETTMSAGYAKGGKADVKVTRTLYPQFAISTLSVSPLPTAYISGLMRYLDSFPYGCTEQIISRVFPQLSLMRFPEFAPSEAQMKEKIGIAVSNLRQRQTDDGGFSLWGGGYNEDNFASVYAMDFLIDAYNADYPVPSDMLQRGIYYLRNWVNQDIMSMDDARVKAYGIYVLTRSGMVTSNEILHWLRYFEDKKNEAWKTDLSAAYIAASYEMMQQIKLANDTMDDFEKGMSAGEISYKDASWDKPYANPFVKYARYVSLLARHFPERFKTLDKQIVFKIADFVNSQRYNTLSASYAIQALSDYAALESEAIKTSGITIKADGKIPEPSGDLVLRVPLSQGISELHITSGKKAFLGVGGNQEPFFYTLSQTGYSRDVRDKPITNGMEIARSYLDKDGKPVSGLVNVGDVIEAVITVRAFDDRTIKNVAIVDLLPAGFALEPEGGEQGSTLFPEFVERREDRLVLFSDVAPQEKTFHYRLRAISKGEFQVPPPYAEAMYDLSKTAKGSAGMIQVRDETR